MNFDYTEEQTALQDTLRRFFARDYGCLLYTSDAADE